MDEIAKERNGCKTLLEHSPVQSSGSYGIVERAIKEVERQVRCMKSPLDERVGSEKNASSNILPWMIECTSVLINMYLVGKDGRTAYKRVKGKKSKTFCIEFGESVLFTRAQPPGRRGKLDTLWKTGSLVGYEGMTGESMVIDKAAA